MTIEEIRQQYFEVQNDVEKVTQEIELDAHDKFVQSLQKYVRKYD